MRAFISLPTAQAEKKISRGVLPSLERYTKEMPSFETSPTGDVVGKKISFKGSQVSPRDTPPQGGPFHFFLQI